MKKLEQDLKRNYEIVQKIGKSVSDLLKESPIQNEDVLKGTNVKQDLLKSDGKSVTNDCLFVEKPPLQPDVQMLNLYSNKISFNFSYLFFCISIIYTFVQGGCCLNKLFT